jgi:hypothetical protein
MSSRLPGAQRLPAQGRLETLAARSVTREINGFIGQWRARAVVLRAKIDRGRPDSSIAEELTRLAADFRARSERFDLECSVLPEEVRTHNFVNQARGGLSDVSHELALLTSQAAVPARPKQ